MLTSTGGSVNVVSIDTSGGAGTTLGGNAGAITLQPAPGITKGALGNIPDGIVTLSGDLVALGGSMTVQDIVVLNSFTANVPIAVLPPRGAELILASSGSLYDSNSAHALARSGLSLTVSEDINFLSSAGTVSATEPLFYSLLTYTGTTVSLGATVQYVLNYDTSPSPPPPPPPSPTPMPRSEYIYELLLSTVEMEEYLPLFYSLPKRPRRCCIDRKEGRQYCIPPYKRFSSFSLGKRCSGVGYTIYGQVI